jgi:hypothetical protein
MSLLERVPLILDAIRLDLLDEMNRKSLVSTREWLEEQSAVKPGYADFLKLSNVRLFDIVACWQR